MMKSPHLSFSISGDLGREFNGAILDSGDTAALLVAPQMALRWWVWRNTGRQKEDLNRSISGLLISDLGEKEKRREEGRESSVNDSLTHSQSEKTRMSLTDGDN